MAGGTDLERLSFVEGGGDSAAQRRPRQLVRAWRRLWRDATRDAAIDALTAGLAYAALLATLVQGDLVEGPMTHSDGARDLATAAALLRDGVAAAHGPGIHGAYFGFLGPLYYDLLAMVLWLRPTVAALCAAIFAWHLGTVAALRAAAREAGARLPWLAPIAWCAFAEFTVRHHLEHESLVGLPVALAMLGLFSYERTGRSTSLVLAAGAAGCAAQLQSLAALQLAAFAWARWRSERSLPLRDALAAVAAWTLPFCLGALSPRGWLHAHRPACDAWWAPFGLVALGTVAALAAVWAPRREGERAALRVAAMVACAPALAALDVSARGGRAVLGYFTYAIPLTAAVERVDDVPAAGGADVEGVAAIVALAIAWRWASRWSTEPRRQRAWSESALVVVVPAAAAYLALSADRFMAHAMPWVSVCIAVALGALRPRWPRAMAALLPLLALSYATSKSAALWASAHHTLSPSRMVPGVALGARQLDDLAAATGRSPRALLGALHGLDACGLPFAAPTTGAHLALTLSGAATEPPSREHLRFVDAPSPAACVAWGDGGRAPERYVPALRYDTVRVEGAPVRALPFLHRDCPQREPRAQGAPFDAHGGCVERPGWLRVTLAHDGDLGGAAPAVSVLTQWGLDESSRPLYLAPSRCEVTLTQDGVGRLAATAVAGDPQVLRFALSPHRGLSTLVVTARCAELRALDVWDAPSPAREDGAASETRAR